jgi:hypothetical protein
VVIDAATRRQIGGLFECQDLGTVELKGLPVAVPAWQVLGEGMLESRFEALHPGVTPLVGRDEEVELLLRRWTQAKAGNGRVVLISAEPGEQVPPRQVLASGSPPNRTLGCAISAHRTIKTARSIR